MMNRKLILIIFLTLLSSGIYAINLDSLERAERAKPDPLPQQMVTFQIGLNVSEENSEAYEVDYAWYALRYAGVGFGLEVDDDHGNRPLVEASSDDNEYDPDRIVKLNLHPMLSFRTPTLWMNHDHDWGILFRCDPGMVFSFPRNDAVYFSTSKGPDDYGRAVYKGMTMRNHNGKWTFWRIRYSLSARFEQVLVSLGWSVSNYNISYCRNNMFYQGQRIYGYDKYDKTNSIFIALSYCF
jgi:hypothetical protein